MDNSAETITTVTAADLIGDYDVVQYMPATHYLLVDPDQLKALEDRIVERILAALNVMGAAVARETNEGPSCVCYVHWPKFCSIHQTEEKKVAYTP
jgi:hypothetical protein